MSSPIFLLELALPEHPDRLVSEWVYSESGSVLVSLILKPRAYWRHRNEYQCQSHPNSTWHILYLCEILMQHEVVRLCYIVTTLQFCLLYVFILESTSLQSNVHSLPSYACDDKHCYGGKEANSCWQDNDHVDSQHHTTRALFPASTHREAEWSISHSTTAKVFLALKCATVHLPSQSYWRWRLGGCLTLPNTTTSCMW